MTTLYIRDVSPVAAHRLKKRAASKGMSLSAYVAAELERMAAMPTADEIYEDLITIDRSDPVPTAEIVEEIRAARQARP